MNRSATPVELNQEKQKPTTSRTAWTKESFKIIFLSYLQQTELNKLPGIYKLKEKPVRRVCKIYKLSLWIGQIVLSCK